MAAATAISLVVGGVGGHFILPQEVVVEKEVIKQVNVTETIEVPVEVIKEVNVTETVEVPVDNGNLQLVLDHIYDNDGSVNYLTDDLDDDEIDQIVDRIVFMNEVKKLSVDAVKDDLFDELDKFEFVRSDNTTVVLDEDDMERLRVDDDDDEIFVEDVDFEDGDAEVKLTGTFEQDDEEFKFEVIARFKDGEYDELRDIVVSQ